MSELTSLAISVALLGGVCTWFTLSVGVLLIWAAFAAWACFSTQVETCAPCAPRSSPIVLACSPHG